MPQRQQCRPARCRPAAFTLAAFLCLSLAAGCQREGGGVEIRVMTSTTMLAAIAGEIGGNRVTVAALVPAGTPPDEFDLRPEHVEKALGADLFIMSGWEAWAPEILGSGSGAGHIAAIDTPGDLMLPYLHLEAADSVTEALVRTDPAGEVFYRYNRADYRSRVGIEAGDICASMSGLRDTRVICSDAQAEFLDYLGFDIVGTYGGPEDLSVEEAARLTEIGRKHAVRLVVDDLHMGKDAGKSIAREIEAVRVVLTRYPDGGSYLGLLKANADKLISALD